MATPYKLTPEDVDRLEDDAERAANSSAGYMLIRPKELLALLRTKRGVRDDASGALPNRYHYVFDGGSLVLSIDRDESGIPIADVHNFATEMSECARDIEGGLL